MQFEEFEEEKNEVELYSKRAIIWFTLFLTTIFGGILLAINLRNAGYKRGALSVILFSIGYYFMASITIARLIPVLLPQFNPKAAADMSIAAALSLSLNFIGALILTQYFYKQYLPDDDYYPRSITTPLLVAVGIFLFWGVIANMLGLQNLTGL